MFQDSAKLIELQVEYVQESIRKEMEQFEIAQRDREKQMDALTAASKKCLTEMKVRYSVAGEFEQIRNDLSKLEGSLTKIKETKDKKYEGIVKDLSRELGGLEKVLKSKADEYDKQIEEGKDALVHEIRAIEEIMEEQVMVAEVGNIERECLEQIRELREKRVGRRDQFLRLLEQIVQTLKQ